MVDLATVRLLTALGVFISVAVSAQPSGPLDAPVRLTASQVVPRNEAVEKAQQQVDEGDFEDAIKTINKGIDEPDLTDDQLAELYRLLGLSHLYLGNEERARDAFEKLLQARPDYELPKSAPPKIRTIYGRIKDDIRKRRVRPVTLTLVPVNEVPGGAAVIVEARIEDLALGAKTKLFYRRAGGQSFSSIDFVRSKTNRTDFSATVPAFEVPTEDQPYEVEYYVEVADAAQRRLAGRGDSYNPLTFKVLAKQSTGGVAEEVPLYKSPWLWIAIGGVVAAGAATGIVYAATANQTATLPVKIQIEGQP